MTIWPLFLLLILFFVGMVLTMRHMFGQNLTEASARLQGLSAEYASRHDELKKRLSEVEQQYQDTMRRAKTEAEQLVAQARDEAAAMRARLLEDSRAESERMVQQGMQSRDALRRDIEIQIETRAIARACELVHEILPGELRQDMQQMWLDELIKNGAGQLKRLKTAEQVEEAKVRSAFSLSADQRKRMHDWLKARFGREIRISEETDEQLIAGFSITLGSLVLDGTLANKLRTAARHATQHAEDTT